MGSLHLHIFDRPTATLYGLKKYFTGMPCKHGHVSEKRTTTGYCMECSRLRMVTPERIQYERDYYQNNKEHVLLRSKKLHEKNKVRNIQKAREWVSNNPERRRIISMNYKAKRRAQESSGVSSIALAAWAEQQKKTCYWCGVSCRGRFHVDHYEPLSKGGAHELHNLVIACPGCNYRKSSTDPYVFAAQVGRLF